MFSYPASVRSDSSGFVVRFSDIPEAIGGGHTKEEAIADAKDSLETSMDFYFETRRPVPLPSDRKRGQVVIDLPASVAAKVLLLNSMIEQKVTPAELARRLHLSPQTVTRIVDFRHSTKIDTIADALQAIGRRLTLAVA